MAVGTWSIGGIKLPDFGITERFAKPSVQPTTFYNPQAAGTGQIGPAQQTQYSTTQRSPAPTNPSPTGSAIPRPLGSVAPAGGAGGGGATQGPDINPGLDQIDQEYQLFSGQLNNQESQLNTERGNAQNTINTGAQAQRNAINEAQSTNLAGLQQQATTATNTQKSQTQQARDIFRQVQQQNIAQLSGQGISSSSVAEALAENLGVETARRIAQSAQSAGDILNNIESEKTRVQTFAKNRLSEIESDVANKMNDLQAQFTAGLNKINEARNLAANDKANRRYDLISQAQQAAQQLQQNAQQYQQALDMWSQQNLQKLGTASQMDFSKLVGAGQQIQTLQGLGLPIPQQLQQNVESYYPGYGGPINVTPKSKDIYGDYGLTP